MTKRITEDNYEEMRQRALDHADKRLWIRICKFKQNRKPLWFRILRKMRGRN
jgi:hypothetical protein